MMTLAVEEAHNIEQLTELRQKRKLDAGDGRRAGAPETQADHARVCWLRKLGRPFSFDHIYIGRPEDTKVTTLD